MDNKFPQATPLSNARDLGRSSPRVMAYLNAILSVKLTKYRAQSEYADVSTAISDTMKTSALREQYIEQVSRKCWLGTATPADLKVFQLDTINYLDASAVEGIKAVNLSLGSDNKLSDIVMAYNIDENAQFNRGYVVNEQPVDEQNAEHKRMLDVIDKMFHSWLVSNGMVSSDSGVIFYTDDSGEMTERVKREDVVRLMNDPDNGFRSTVEKIDPSIQLAMVWIPIEGEAEQFIPQDQEMMKEMAHSAQVQGGKAQRSN